jgi:hypothetical protein
VDSSLIVTALGLCAYLAAGLVILVVGAVSARPAEPRAGYLAIGAGVLMMLDGCCNIVPTIFIEAEADIDLAQNVSTCNAWLGLPLLLAYGAMIIGAAVLLALKASSLEGRPS